MDSLSIVVGLESLNRQWKGCVARQFAHRADLKTGRNSSNQLRIEVESTSRISVSARNWEIADSFFRGMFVALEYVHVGQI
jgi:hypothetical protein